jgi:hypothetical protein
MIAVFTKIDFGGFALTKTKSALLTMSTGQDYVNVVEIKYREDQEAIFRVWNNAGRPNVEWLDTFPCRYLNAARQCKAQCKFSHETLFKKPLVRCQACNQNRCKRKCDLVLKWVMAQNGKEERAYSVCLGFVDDLNTYLRNKADMTVAMAEARRVSPVIFRAAPTIHDSVTIPRCPVSPPKLVIPTEKERTSLDRVGNTDRKRERETTASTNSLDNMCVYLPVHAGTIERIQVLLKQPNFEGMLKIKTRKLESLALNMNPDDVMLLKEELSTTPVGQMAIKAADAIICNQQLLGLR